MNKSDLESIAEVRIAEATVLLANDPPMPDGAYYLAGYAVECALKACIAKLNNQHDWPDKSFVQDCHTHSVTALLRLAGLKEARDADATGNSAFELNWNIVKDWNERSRYEKHSVEKARELVDAVTDNMHGVLTWIKAHW